MKKHNSSIRRILASFISIIMVFANLLVPSTTYAVGQSMALIVNPSGQDQSKLTQLISEATTISVDFSISATNGATNIFGGQFFLNYNPSVIELTGITQVNSNYVSLASTNYAEKPTGATEGYEAVLGANGSKTAAQLGKVNFAMEKIMTDASAVAPGVMFKAVFTIKGVGHSDITLTDSMGGEGNCLFDELGGKVIGIANVTNAQVDIVTYPALQSAAVSEDGTKVVLTFDKSMDSNSFGTAPSGFAVTTGSSNTANVITNVAIDPQDSKKIILSLTNKIYNSNTTTNVKVAYTAGTVKAADTTALQTFTATDVTNSSIAALPPVLQSSNVVAAGNKIQLVFDKNMKGTTVGPGTCGFTVTTGQSNTANAVTAVALNADNKILELTLTNIIYNSTTNIKVSYAPGTVAAADGGLLSTINATVVGTNNSTIPSPPVVLGATTNTAGNKVILTFDKVINANLGTSPAGFSVTTGNTNTVNDITGVALSSTDSKKVEISLTDIMYSSTLNIKVSYTPGSVSSEDTATLQAFTGQAVANASTVIIPPTLQSVEVNAAGTKVVLTFDKNMSSTLPTAPAGFAVTMGAEDTSNVVKAVGLNADPKKIELTLTDPVYTTTTNINVAFTAGTSKVKAADNSELANFTAQAVTNNSTVVVPPIFQTAAVNEDGTKVLLTFNKNMSGTFGTSAPYGFTVTTGSANTGNIVTGAALNTDNKIIELTLTNPVYFDTTNIKVTYVPGTVKSADGGILAALTNQSVSTANCTVFAPPQFVSAASSADGTKITVTFDKAMNSADLGAGARGFAVTMGTENTVNAVTAISAGTSNKDIVLTLTTPIYKDTTTIKVSYTPGSVKSDDTGVLAAFSGKSVTNNTTNDRFTVTTTYKVGTTTVTALQANQILTASSAVHNNQSVSQEVVLIVALYNSSNEMVNVSFLSKQIAGGGDEVFNAGFKLPASVTGYSVKAFVWDGSDITTTNMMPVSNVEKIPQ